MAPPAMSAARAAGIAGESERRPVTLVVQVVASLLRSRAGLAVAGNGAVDHARIDPLHGLVAQSEALHHAGPELLDEDVGPREQRLEAAPAGGALEIDDDTLLGAVQGRIGCRADPEGRRELAHLVAAGLLDLDDFRPGLGEHQGGERSGQQGREVEDEEAFKR